MSGKTSIEWTEYSWNPIRGCSRVSEGCRNCYAETVANRFKGEGQPYAGLIAKGGQWNGTIKFVGGDVLTQPARWRRPRRIFVNSMSDLFHESVPVEWIDEIFAVMACTEQHTFQVLTKRADRMRAYLSKDRRRQWADAAVGMFGGGDPDSLHDAIMDGDKILPNVWIGVSVEDQKAADERIPLLLDTPAAVRWISAEPLLGPVDVSRWLNKQGITCMDVCPDTKYVDDHDVETETIVKPGDFHEIVPRCPHCGEVASWTGYDPGLDWVVVGGESGPHARPMHPRWARDLRDQCAAAGVPFLFKQWGEWASHPYPADGVVHVRADGSTGNFPLSDSWSMKRVGKKAAGRLLDGVQHDGYPEAPA